MFTLKQTLLITDLNSFSNRPNHRKFAFLRDNLYITLLHTLDQDESFVVVKNYALKKLRSVLKQSAGLLPLAPEAMTTLDIPLLELLHLYVSLMNSAHVEENADIVAHCARLCAFPAADVTAVNCRMLLYRLKQTAHVKSGAAELTQEEIATVRQLGSSNASSNLPSVRRQSRLVSLEFLEEEALENTLVELEALSPSFQLELAAGYLFSRVSRIPVVLSELVSATIGDLADFSFLG